MEPLSRARGDEPQGKCKGVIRDAGAAVRKMSQSRARGVNIKNFFLGMGSDATSRAVKQGFIIISCIIRGEK